MGKAAVNVRASAWGRPSASGGHPCFYCGEAVDADAVRGAEVIAHRRCVQKRLAVLCHPPMNNVDALIVNGGRARKVSRLR
jgi:hypothetical protein